MIFIFDINIISPPLFVTGCLQISNQQKLIKSVNFDPTVMQSIKKLSVFFPSPEKKQIRTWEVSDGQHDITECNSFVLVVPLNRFEYLLLW